VIKLVLASTLTKVVGAALIDFKKKSWEISGNESKIWVSK
jgi:hypothetical protein